MALERMLIVPDVHVPFHDRRAWELLLKVGEAIKPKHLITLGDFADCFAVSFHPKDPKRRLSLKDEVAAVNRCLDDLDRLKPKNKRFIEGNHEYRLARYLTEKAPELFGMVSIPELFHLERRGWGFTPYRSDYRLGQLWMTHDVGSAGWYSAYKVLDTYQHCVVTGHTHRLSYAVEGNATGEYHVSATFGWLGSAEAADYMHRVKAQRDWALGFGVGWLDPATGHVHLTPIPIVKYTCVVDGAFYSVPKPRTVRPAA